MPAPLTVPDADRLVALTAAAVVAPMDVPSIVPPVMTAPDVVTLVAFTLVA